MEDASVAPFAGIRALRARKAAGEELSDEEEQKLREANNAWSSARINLHLKKGRREQWQQLADAQGASLSSWVQERVVEALQGESAKLRDLRLQNQALQDEIVGLRASSGALAVENQKLNVRMEALEASLMQAMDQALQLAEGAG